MARRKKDDETRVKRITITVDPDVYEHLKATKNYSSYICRLVRQDYRQMVLPLVKVNNERVQGN